MTIAASTVGTDTIPAEASTSSETRDEKIARYGSPEFTQQLTEAFHRAKRQGIQADREAANPKNQAGES